MENVTPAFRALAALDNPPAEIAAAPARRISKKVIAAIDAMVSGECKKISEAAERVGLARESLSRALSSFGRGFGGRFGIRTHRAPRTGYESRPRFSTRAERSNITTVQYGPRFNTALEIIEQNQQLTKSHPFRQNST